MVTKSAFLEVYYSGNIEIVKLILNCGITFDTYQVYDYDNNYGRSSGNGFSMACGSCAINIVELLLENNYSPITTKIYENWYYCPLREACLTNSSYCNNNNIISVKLVKLLIQNGVDIYDIDHRNMDAFDLLYFWRRDKLGILELISTGYNPDLSRNKLLLRKKHGLSSYLYNNPRKHKKIIMERLRMEMVDEFSWIIKNICKSGENAFNNQCKSNPIAHFFIKNPVLGDFLSNKIGEYINFS